MSHNLIKLLDVALVPAALMVVSKLIGLVLVVNFFDIDWELGRTTENIFSIEATLGQSDLLTVSTYSDVFMFIILSIGFSLILLQATHFHATHIKPSLLVQLSNNNLMGLVKSSFDIYHAAGIWLIFLWVASGTIWLNVVLGKTEPWIGILSVFANIIFTTLVLQDVYKEIELSKKNLGRHDALT